MKHISILRKYKENTWESFTKKLFLFKSSEDDGWSAELAIKI